MEREVKIPSAWSSTPNRVFIGVLVASVALLAAALPLAIATHAATGTFHTGDLVVDQTATLGATATGNNQATLHVNNTSAGPIEIDHDGTNSQTVAVIVHGTNIRPQPTNERQAVNALIDTTIDTTLGNVLSMGFQTSVNSSKSAGGNLLTNAAFVASAQNGDDNLSFLGIHGLMENDEGALIKSNGGTVPVTLEKVVVQSGGINVTGTGQPVTLGDTVNSFAMPNASGGVSPQITMGVALHAQPYMIAAKPTVSTSIDAFWLALDTTVNAAARGGFIVSRGAGGFGASVEGGIAVASASGFPFVGMAANDYGVFAEGGGDLYLGADNSTFVPAVKVKSSDNTVHILNGALDLESHLIHNVTDPASAQDAATKAYVDSKASTIQSSVYYADGTDGTCAFDGVTTPVCGASLVGSVYTLTRDIAPNIMTVAAGVTVREDNFRIMVYTSLTGGGAGAKISNSGFDAGSGDAHIGGNCGGINSHYFQACATNGGNGSNLGTGVGNNGNANAGAIPQWPAQTASAAGANGAGHGQAGGGGTTGAQAGGTGGSITNPSVNVGYFTAVGGWSGRYDSYGNQWALYGTGGGGGGCVGGACLGGGGGGGGGIDFVATNQCLGTISIEAKGGNGANGVLAGGTGAGGGGGGGGGVVVLIYSHRSAGCTTSVVGGTHGTGTGTGANGGDGSSGSTLLYNLSGDGS